MATLGFQGQNLGSPVIINGALSLTIRTVYHFLQTSDLVALSACIGIYLSRCIIPPASTLCVPAPTAPSLVSVTHAKPERQKTVPTIEESSSAAPEFGPLLDYLIGNLG